MITPFMKIFKISVLNILSREFYDVNLSNKYEMPSSTNVPWSLWTRSPVYLRNQGPLQEITVNQG